MWCILILHDECNIVKLSAVWMAYHELRFVWWSDDGRLQECGWNSQCRWPDCAESKHFTYSIHSSLKQLCPTLHTTVRCLRCCNNVARR